MKHLENSFKILKETISIWMPLNGSEYLQQWIPFINISKYQDFNSELCYLSYDYLSQQMKLNFKKIKYNPIIIINLSFAVVSTLILF